MHKEKNKFLIVLVKAPGFLLLLVFGQSLVILVTRGLGVSGLEKSYVSEV